MKQIFAILFVVTCIVGCSGSSGGNSNGAGTPPPAPAGDPQTTPDPVPGDDGEYDFTKACIIREANSKIYYTGYGTSDQEATEFAGEVCRGLAPAPADCQQPAICETRIATEKWSCSVRNSRTGDVWTDEGRSKVEAFSFIHGICAAGHNADPIVCGTFEQSTCVMKE